MMIFGLGRSLMVNKKDSAANSPWRRLAADKDKRQLSDLEKGYEGEGDREG